eukprot:672303-Rhodomonas_salina.4
MFIAYPSSCSRETRRQCPDGRACRTRSGASDLHGLGDHDSVAQELIPRDPRADDARIRDPAVHTEADLEVLLGVARERDVLDSAQHVHAHPHRTAGVVVFGAAVVADDHHDHVPGNAGERAAVTLAELDKRVDHAVEHREQLHRRQRGHQLPEPWPAQSVSKLQSEKASIHPQCFVWTWTNSGPQDHKKSKQRKWGACGCEFGGTDDPAAEDGGVAVLLEDHGLVLAQLNDDVLGQQPRQQPVTAHTSPSDTLPEWQAHTDQWSLQPALGRNSEQISIARPSDVRWNAAT